VFATSCRRENKKKLTGTARHASVNTHFGVCEFIVYGFGACAPSSSHEGTTQSSAGAGGVSSHEGTTQASAGAGGGVF
jgi:hypothetical protein